MEIKKFGITLKLVDFSDAEFILSLRSNINKSRFISKTSNKLSDQIEWLTKYKDREREGKEYYFIAIDEKGRRFSTYRIYNLDQDFPEIGSWITIPNLLNPINAIKVDFLVKEFTFKELKYEKLIFEVRKGNRSVINYHKKYESEIVSEDELNYYFELSYNNFNKNKSKFVSKFN
ncbi:N-acetyltransferase [Apibacter muscae]|uniref:GNAT family N-acetyltransferase n=1 Tax=Apibacter muscae TaxID=2509004 RepID=UPI0011AC6E46|nr:GNAT family N-acetyltransferase [Apibacter muscae]TWP25136.1 N-acetyltransferase [Apibacter muscae]